MHQTLCSQHYSSWHGNCFGKFAAFTEDLGCLLHQCCLESDMMKTFGMCSQYEFKGGKVKTKLLLKKITISRISDDFTAKVFGGNVSPSDNACSQPCSGGNSDAGCGGGGVGPTLSCNPCESNAQETCNMTCVGASCKGPSCMLQQSCNYC